MKRLILFLIVIMLISFGGGCGFNGEKPVVSFIYEESSKDTFSKDRSGESDLSSEALTTSNTENNRDTVYKTPTGKRYHFSYICGGENGIEITLEEAISLGLTPCQKCVN